MLFILTDSPERLRLKKIHYTLIFLLYVGPSHFLLQRLFFIKNTKKNSHYPTSDWSIYTKSCFKENAKIFSKKPTTAFFNKKLKKKTTLKQVGGGKKPNVVLKRMLELPLLKKY